MIIFLDFDGVLHPVPADMRGLFCHLPRLEALLRQHPHVQIVISSSWRETYPWGDVILEIFSPDIRPRIVGMTPTLEIRDACDIIGSRYREILDYLGGSGADWLALDDDASLFPPGCTELVLCEDGFCQAEEDELRERLKSC